MSMDSLDPVTTDPTAPAPAIAPAPPEDWPAADPCAGVPVAPFIHRVMPVSYAREVVHSERLRAAMVGLGIGLVVAGYAMWLLICTYRRPRPEADHDDE